MYTKKDQKIYDKTKKFLENINDTEIEEKMKKIDSVLKISDTKERYSYLFELICDYLDNEFRKNNLCDFDNCGLCKRRRALKEKNPNKETYLYGCCYSYINKRVCPFLNKDGSCTNRNIGCKLFTCHYLKKEGYTLKVTEYTDYVQPNNVVESGEVDANFFQHVPYLDDFNKENKTHLVSAAGIHVEPFGLYPGKQKSLDAIKK